MDAEPREISLDDVRQAQRGDREAFARLFRHTAPGVSRYVRSILRDRGSVEDAVAQTFCDAWESVGRLREPDRFEAWLFRLAHHRAIDELRRRRPDDLATAPEPPSDASTDPCLLAQAREERVELHRALARLPESERHVLVLFYLRQMSHREIACKTQRSEDASRALLYRARKRLRRELSAVRLPLAESGRAEPTWAMSSAV